MKRTSLAGLLLFGLFTLCVIFADFWDRNNNPDLIPDPDWSSNALLAHGVSASDIKKIDIFYSDKDNGNEKSYKDLIKMNAILKLDSHAKISEFLINARSRPQQIESFDLENPDKVYHIVLWKANQKGYGYGRLLLFERRGREYGFLKAADGTGDYEYNLDLIKYINDATNGSGLPPQQ